jgi:hypothetical protein
VDEIDALTEQMQGKQRDEAFALIVDYFGQPTRNIGSGLSIPQWDICGGVLTFHPLSGPRFTIDDTTKWLIRTANSVVACVFGHYDMSTLADNWRTTYSLGSISLSAEGHYTYTASFPQSPPRTGQGQNFFIRHPQGSAAVVYAPDITSQTLLENLPDWTVIANVTFVASNGDTQTYFVIVDSDKRRLLLESAEPILFRLSKGWVNFCWD